MHPQWSPERAHITEIIYILVGNYFYCSRNCIFYFSAWWVFHRELTTWTIPKPIVGSGVIQWLGDYGLMKYTWVDIFSTSIGWLVWFVWFVNLVNFTSEGGAIAKYAILHLIHLQVNYTSSDVQSDRSRLNANGLVVDCNQYIFSLCYFIFLNIDKVNHGFLDSFICRFHEDFRSVKCVLSTHYYQPHEVDITSMATNKSKGRGTL